MSHIITTTMSGHHRSPTITCCCGLPSISRTAHHHHIRPTAAAGKELAGKIQGCRRGIKQRQRGGDGCFWTTGISGKKGCGSRFRG
ncbi:hypothetical protein LXL04_001868 [Taraxacum kok-saghyz]